MNWPPDKPAQAALPMAAGKRAANGPAHPISEGCLRLEIGAETLLRLMASGQLCAADFRCLDCESKHCVWRLLLMSCKKTLHTDSGCGGRCSECGGSRDTLMDEGPKLSVPILAESWPELVEHEPLDMQAGAREDET